LSSASVSFAMISDERDPILFVHSLEKACHSRWLCWINTNSFKGIEQK
jgi:hypothetical protein